MTRWAVEPLDLLRELRKVRPTVVHFSGQPSRDIVDADPAVVGDRPDARAGLYLQGSDGRPRLVSAAALREMFGAAGSSVRLVVLNTCYTEPQAQALLAHVDCVVGMSGSILDDAARAFAVGFYGGLGERESVEAACNQGRATILLSGLRDGDRPRLAVRAGVDAGRLLLAADPR